ECRTAVAAAQEPPTPQYAAGASSVAAPVCRRPLHRPSSSRQLRRRGLPSAPFARDPLPPPPSLLLPLYAPPSRSATAATTAAAPTVEFHAGAVPGARMPPDLAVDDLLRALTLYNQESAVDPTGPVTLHAHAHLHKHTLRLVPRRRPRRSAASDAGPVPSLSNNDDARGRSAAEVPPSSSSSEADRTIAPRHRHIHLHLRRYHIGLFSAAVATTTTAPVLASRAYGPFAPGLHRRFRLPRQDLLPNDALRAALRATTAAVARDASRSATNPLPPRFLVVEIVPVDSEAAAAACAPDESPVVCEATYVVSAAATTGDAAATGAAAAPLRAEVGDQRVTTVRDLAPDDYGSAKRGLDGSQFDLEDVFGFADVSSSAAPSDSSSSSSSSSSSKGTPPPSSSRTTGRPTADDDDDDDDRDHDHDHDGGGGGGGGDDDDEALRDCVVCLSEPMDTLALPCRHLCL
ncbi:hypothetical protein HK405_014872, partial [Cladochytrium tenue]